MRDLEAMYLLGDFGVRLKGFESVITKRPAELNFGNIAVQDLPFYRANVDYIYDIDVPQNGTLKISATNFRCPLVAVERTEGARWSYEYITDPTGILKRPEIRFIAD